MIKRLSRINIKLQWKISLLICGVLIIAFLVTNLLISRDVTTRTNDHLSEKVMNIARMVAQAEVVVDGLQGDRPKAEVQVYANKVMELTDVGFVVVLDMNLIRLSHPDETAIGGTFSMVDDAAAALEGEEYVTVAEGILGLGKRAFTPIYNEDGKQIGVVVVGVSMDEVNSAIQDSRWHIYTGSMIGLCFGIFGAFFLGRHIKRILFNLEPIQIATLLKERDAMLQSVKEGIIAVDNNKRITLVNEEATRILQLKHEATELTDLNVGEHIPIFQKVLETGKERIHMEEVINDIDVLLNCVPIVVDDEIVGAITTFRDKSEVKKLSEELTGIQLYTEMLRTQSHEFMNKLHVVLGMVQIGSYDKLSEYIQQVVHQYEKEVDFIVGKIKNPIFAGFLLGKCSKARENDIEFIVTEDSFLPNLEDNDFVHQLIEIVGNLINNAFDALKESENKKIELFILYEEGKIYIEVRDTGKGIPKEVREHIFEKGFSTHGENRGLGLHLVQQNVRRLHGEIEMYTVTGKGTAFHIALQYRDEEGIN